VPKLLIAGEDGSERVIELTERTLQIGRGPGNDIILSDASHGVSRTHAELRFRNGRCVIVDLQSQNGTWLNGQRVQHAEVPPNSEIVIGTYRLRVVGDDLSRSVAAETGATASLHPVGPSSVRGSSVRRRIAAGIAPPFPDMPLVRPHDDRQPVAAKSRPGPTQVLLLAGFVIAVAAFTWRMIVAPVPSAVAQFPQAPQDPTGGDTGAVPSPAVDTLGTAAPSAATPASDPPADAGSRPAPKSPEPRPNVGVRPDAPPVTQRPGESTEAWRARTAAFQTRYVYSRAALDRGDFAAAAGGFEAILREEPGFLDVPQLLLRARAGLRAAAVDVFETGQRLETAGEWLGALQKYEQARQVHAEIPGLTPAINRVRGKLRVAGNGAFTRARQLEARGVSAEALREYEKAVQWLPVDDPNRAIAVSRIEQLKRSIP
jgi:predicted component of type VI protein secretion system